MIFRKTILFEPDLANAFPPVKKFCSFKRELDRFSSGHGAFLGREYFLCFRQKAFYFQSMALKAFKTHNDRFKNDWSADILHFEHEMGQGLQASRCLDVDVELLDVEQEIDTLGKCVPDSSEVNVFCKF